MATSSSGGDKVTRNLVIGMVALVVVVGASFSYFGSKAQQLPQFQQVFLKPTVMELFLMRMYQMFQQLISMKIFNAQFAHDFQPLMA
jgi:hypothetical protein